MMKITPEENENSGRRLIFRSVEKLCNHLKIVDLRNLNQLDVPVANNIDIFGILNRRNSNIKNLTFGTSNIEFARSAFNRFFAVEQPRKMENERGFNRSHLKIYFSGDYRLFLDILRNNLGEVENVEEFFSDQGDVFSNSKRTASIVSRIMTVF
uniref:Recep_L_domain domain-containing protein n=1 Tax=Strongyloides venezuelensis TaxID=75913 RepID=A0A0K0EZG1_STRVS